MDARVSGAMRGGKETVDGRTGRRRDGTSIACDSDRSGDEESSSISSSNIGTGMFRLIVRERGVAMRQLNFEDKISSTRVFYDSTLEIF